MSETKSVSIRMPLDIYKKIKKISDEENRTVSGQIIYMLLKSHINDIKNGGSGN